ncbi:MAG: hypothetical protein BWK79_14110 [Beggiatoa sp. IS2]|nr:MAG: hypothetical protein BWK79_14110 [Beggiatoa sp. IS2]
MEASAVKTCVEQTDRHLNENYQILLKKFKEDAKLLKDMQLGWIKMRDAQCELAGKHTGSQAALVMSKCTVVLTQKRADELEKIADALFFAW